MFVGFTLRFADPASPRTIVFEDTSTRPEGGGNILTRLSTNSTLARVATLTSGTIVSGFGSIQTEETINTTCVTGFGDCGEIIASGNLTVESNTLTRAATYIGSAFVTTAITTTATFTGSLRETRHCLSLRCRCRSAKN